MSLIREIITEILREEIGRNYHTVDTSPVTFRDFADYETEIFPLGDGTYILNLSYKKEPVFTNKKFKDREEAGAIARKFIDAHRVSVMNSMR